MSQNQNTPPLERIRDVRGLTPAHLHAHRPRYQHFQLLLCRLPPLVVRLPMVQLRVSRPIPARAPGFNKQANRYDPTWIFLNCM